MKKNQKKKKKVLSVLVLVLLVLGITIGYAILSQQLVISGTSTISNASWDVHFENVAITEGSVTATTAPVAAATDKKTTLTYAVGNLTLPGQFYEFTVDVKNGGSVDAKLDAVPVLVIVINLLLPFLDSAALLAFTAWIIVFTSLAVLFVPS